MPFTVIVDIFCHGHKLLQWPGLVVGGGWVWGVEQGRGGGRIRVENWSDSCSLL